MAVEGPQRDLQKQLEELVFRCFSTYESLEISEICWFIHPCSEISESQTKCFKTHKFWQACRILTNHCCHFLVLFPVLQFLLFVFVASSVSPETRPRCREGLPSCWSCQWVGSDGRVMGRQELRTSSSSSAEMPSGLNLLVGYTMNHGFHPPIYVVLVREETMGIIILTNEVWKNFASRPDCWRVQLETDPDGSTCQSAHAWRSTSGLPRKHSGIPRSHIFVWVGIPGIIYGCTKVAVQEKSGEPVLPRMKRCEW